MQHCLGSRIRAKLLQGFALALGGGLCPAHAQMLQQPVELSISIPDATAFLAPNAAAPLSPFSQSANDFVGKSIGEWLLYPTIYGGFTYNNNLLATATNRVGDYGYNYIPSFVAVRNTGIQNTLVYGTLNATDYFHHSSADTDDGRIGFQHHWEVTRDFILNFDGSAKRATDPTNGGDVISGVTFIPVSYQVYTVHASAVKSLEKFYFTIGGTLSNTTYDNTTLTNGAPLYQAYRDVTEPRIVSRIGYKVSPIIYAFTEASVNWQNNYNSQQASSDGYRAVAGLGSERVSLFSGEVFFGYQEQFFRLKTIGDVGQNVIGGRVSWFPTQMLSFGASVDETIGTNSFISTINPTASATKTTEAEVTANYSLPERWSALLRAGFARSVYVGVVRVDEMWTLGTQLNYHINKQLILTVDYKFRLLNSTAPSADYNNNIVLAGMTYRY